MSERVIRSGATPRERCCTFNGEEPSVAIQSAKDECDINQIMAKAKRTGMVNHINAHAPRYGEVHGGDFHDAMNIVTQATTAFEELPAAARAHFGEPGAMLDYFDTNPDGPWPELEELGLLREGFTYKTAPESADGLTEPSPTGSEEGQPIDAT